MTEYQNEPDRADAPRDGRPSRSDRPRRSGPVPYDPSRDDAVNPRRLRGIAHPLRLRILWALREHGPSTATKLGQELGQSSGATSYHLRQLAAYGFVVDEPGRGTDRERWWRAAMPGTHVDLPPTEDVEGRIVTEEYLRTVATLYAERMQRTISELATMPPEWHDSGTISDVGLRLTAEEAQELIAEIFALAHRYRRYDAPDVPAGSRRVAFQFQVLPQEES